MFKVKTQFLNSCFADKLMLFRTLVNFKKPAIDSLPLGHTFFGLAGQCDLLLQLSKCKRFTKVSNQF